MPLRTIAILCIVLVFSTVSLVNSQPAQGDWIVVGEEVVENRTITLDGSLFVKSGSSLTLRGVTLMFSSSYMGQYGISAEPGSSLFIYNSTIIPTDERYGPVLTVTDAKFVMKNSRLQGSTGSGDRGEWFSISRADSVVIEDSTIMMFNYNATRTLHLAMWGVESAIGLRDLSNAVIRNNVILPGGNVKLYLFLKGSHNTTMVGNSIEFSDLILEGTWNSCISGNNLGLRGGSGLVIYVGCGNNIVDNNTFSALSEYGGICRAFSLISSPYPNAFTNNVIKGSIYDREGDSFPDGMGFLTGVLISQSSNAIIANNSLIQFPIGEPSHNEAMQVYRSDSNLILNNFINSTNSGIILFASSGNTLKGNSVLNSGRGIGLYYSSDNNVIENNTMEDNLVNMVFDDASNNTVRVNVFGASERQGYDDSSNSWGRNYWSDYTGEDRGDGIGVVSYRIPPNGSDDEPLVNRLSLTSVPVPPLKTVPFEDVFLDMPPSVDRIFLPYNRTLRDQVITLTGSGGINLQEGDSLTLENITLVAAPSKILQQYTFYVGSGASLSIHRSKVIGGEKGPAIQFTVEKGGKLVIKDSELYNLGCPWTQEGAGIGLHSTDVLIENNIIVGSKQAMEIMGASDARIANNTISKCLFGIFIGGMQNSTIIGNTITEVAHKSFVIQASFNSVVVGNTMSEVWGFIGNNNAAWAFKGGQPIVFENNTILNYMGGFPGELGADFFPPKVAIVKPTQGECLGGVVNTAISAEDEESGLERVDLYIDEVFTWSFTQAPYQMELDTTEIGDGPHQVKAMAFDREGNERSEEIKVTIDNTVPKLAIVSPKEGDSLVETIEIAFMVSDVNLGKVLLQIDNTTYDVTTGTPFSWDTATVADGPHTITMTATDMAENVASTSITAITVNVEREAARTLAQAAKVKVESATRDAFWSADARALLTQAVSEYSEATEAFGGWNFDEVTIHAQNAVSIIDEAYAAETSFRTLIGAGLSGLVIALAVLTTFFYRRRHRSPAAIIKKYTAQKNTHV